jgi:hypothetical protein
MSALAPRLAERCMAVKEYLKMRFEHIGLKLKKYSPVIKFSNPRTFLQPWTALKNQDCPG